MYPQGPVAKRTRGKEAEFYKQCYNELKKKRVEENSVSKETESASSGWVKNGNSCGSSSKKSVRKVSGFRTGSGDSDDARRDDIGSFNLEHLEFLETDHRYEMFLSCYLDSSQRSVDRRSVFSGSEGFRTNLMRDNVSDDYYGVDIDENFENNNGILQSDTDFMEEDGNGDADNDGGGGASVGSADMNFCETSEDDSDNMQLVTRECVITSDDDDDVEVCEISDGNSDQLEPFGMQHDFQAESVRSSDADDADKSSEDTSEESEFSSEEDSGEDGEDEDYKEEKSDSDDEELSSDFEEERIEHLKFSKKNGSDKGKKDYAEMRKNVPWSSASGKELSSDYEEEEEEQFEFTTKYDSIKGEKDDAKKARKNVSWSSASDKELGSDNEEEKEQRVEVSKKNDADKVKKDEAKTEMMRKNISWSSASAKELGSDNEEEEEEKVEVSKKNDADKVKKDEAKTEMMRKNVSEGSNSAEELGSDHEEKEEEQFEFYVINNSRRGHEVKADSKRGKEDNAKSEKRKNVFRNLLERKRSNTYLRQGNSDVSLVRGEINCVAKHTRSRRKLIFTSVSQPICLDEELGDGNDNDDSETNRSNVIDLTVNPKREENRSMEKKGESCNKEAGSECVNGLGKDQTTNVKGEENWSVERNEESSTEEAGNECVKDLVKKHTIKFEREEKRSVERKGESANKEAGDKCVKNVCKEQPNIRKRIRAPKTTRDVVKILADSILEHSEIPFEEEKKQPFTKPSLPLKFTFGVEESTPPEKSEQEKELDELWAEMAIALCETVAENNVQVDGATDVIREVELDRDALCDQGDHCFILDEEIGLKCKYCFFIKTESKYLTVPFSENPFGRSGRRGSFTVQHDTLGDFHYHMADNSGSTHDSDLLKQGTVWDIIPGIDNGMHPHQKEGFEFLWRNIAGDIHIEKQKEDGVGGESGCVISHAPGTGKTRLTIAFLQTYVKQYPLCRAVIIAPCGMLPTWEAEFQKWKVDIPFHNLNSGELSGKENILALKLAIKVNSAKKDKLTRWVKLYSWAKDRSILGMSYRIFAELVGAVKSGNTEEDEAENNRKILFEQTGLIVLDEGHIARNENSLIWQALSKVHTKKRIILSGTPFQNNFDELYNIFWLARPKFAEDIPCKRQEQSKRRRRKKFEARQVWVSITDQIYREKNDSLKAQSLAQLREIMGPFVHIHKGNILQEKLPGLRDSVIVLEPCELQKKLLVNAQAMDQRYYFGKERMISLLSVHPSLLLDIEFDSQKISLEIDRLESILRQLRLNPEVGIKTKFLKELIRLCEAASERVLVFSQYLDPLDLIIEQLKSQFKWSEGREILYIYGKLDVDKRQQLIKYFNDPKSEAKVLLASIKACSEGINLVGASRVVLLDVVWNPSVERQAISRAYRLGQERVVHIYHLITSGTMEEEKYCRQSEKDRLSNLLFDSADKADGVQKTPSNLSDEKADLILEHMRDHEKLKDMFKNIIYQPKDTNLIESFGFLDS